MDLGFPGGSEGKESVCNVEDLVSIPGLGSSSGGGLLASDVKNWVPGAVLHRNKFTGRTQAGMEKEGQ